MKGTLY